MIDPRIIELSNEIRDLYNQQCALADRYSAVQKAALDRLREKCRPRPNPALPEIERFETVFDSSEAIRKAHADPGVRGRRQLVMLACVVALFIINMRVLQWTGSLSAAFVMCAVFGGVLIIAAQRTMFTQREFRRKLREQLVARGVPICLSCGYDLRGQVVPRCPECGTACDRRLISSTQGV